MKGLLMNYLRRLFLGTVFFVGGPLLCAQPTQVSPQPDCGPTAFNFVGGNGIAPTIPTAYFDNRTVQCQTWTVAYEADSGLSGYTVAFQSATGSTAPGTFGAYSGNTVNSSASWGTAALGLATYCDLASCSSGGTTVNTPWVRLLASGATGTGNIRGVIYGYKTGYTGGTGGAGGGGGGGGGCTSPCPVVGTAAAGSPPSGDPVQVGGSDGTDLRALHTDTSGNLDVNVQPSGLSTLKTGQQSVTASAVNLGANAARSVCLVADIGNTIPVYFGPSGVTTSTGTPLVAGQSTCLQLANGNLVYVIASTTGALAEWYITD